MDDPARPGTLVGTVVAPLLSPRRLRVVDGVFRLVRRDPSRVGTWRMSYSMGLLADDGRRFQLDGTKLMHGDGLAAWSQTTTLRVVVSEQSTGKPVAAGVLTLSPAEFARLLASMRVTGVAGRLDLTALGHIARIVRGGAAVDAGGADLYLAHPERLRLPLLLVQGEHNAIFRPEGSLRTLRWLAAANGPSYYERVVLPDYAHLDAVIGRDAWRDVYPLISDHLDRYR